MYWPIGAPRVYAASKHELPQGQILASDDDLVHTGTSISTTDTNGNEKDGRSVPAGSPTASDDHDEAQTQEQELAGSPNTAVTSSDSQMDGAAEADNTGEIVGLRVARNGYMFATITRSTLTIWQTKPTVILASVLRSPQSLKTYGPNVAVLIRPDSAIFVVQTAFGYLITYSLAADHTARVFVPHYPDYGGSHARRHSIGGHKAFGNAEAVVGAGEGTGVREVSIRFRMIIRVDAGIGRALALDEELVVATNKPAAIQCIRWAPDRNGSATSTELLSRMSWIGKRTTIVDMVHDRPMNLSTWITSDGKAYAVQRVAPGTAEDTRPAKSLFKGYGFHIPETEACHGVKAAINARFSLIAIGCADGGILVYNARDYAGHIPLSHQYQPNSAASRKGELTFLSYSPDGYCLFAGYEKGWVTWSVFGKPGGSSFISDRSMSESNDEGWLGGVRDGFWIGGGAELLLLGPKDNRLWVIEMARNAVAGCFSSANVARSLLQTSAGFSVYRGYDIPELTTISSEASSWHHVQIPTTYLVNQWPIRSAVISADGKYVAVAGRRGLAHYSVNSGRWKTFDDLLSENEFTVRGGMCWHQYVLIAAVESNDSYELRMYSRELALESSQVLHTEQLPAPIVTIALSGNDSLLVYTYENILYHYIINVISTSVKLVPVGRIALHGIIRAPPRVRAMSWILPEYQLENGDPSKDVAVATILFLVDGKLVLLHPTTSDNGELKYEMRIIAQNVEYYALMRDQPSPGPTFGEESSTKGPSVDILTNSHHGYNLRDSLWFFDGSEMRVWIDVQDVLSSVSLEHGRDLPAAINVAVDFYPLTVLLSKGILFGLESEIVQRRDINFAMFRFTTRTHLFLPPLLRYHLAQYDSPAALHLSHYYQHLDYFPHALEVLLHNVLDEEVDTAPPSEQALLPSVLSFLSSFPQYLDIIVQCTRKTEVRSWRTLFAHLPSPQELFEESLQKGSLKTAGGYLLILHTFEELSSSSQQLIRLLQRAKEKQDWELCKELARFLMALDESGGTLREALEVIELKSPSDGKGGGGFSMRDSPLNIPQPRVNGVGLGLGIGAGDASGASSRSERHSPRSADSKKSEGHQPQDYFSSFID